MPANTVKLLVALFLAGLAATAFFALFPPTIVGNSPAGSPLPDRRPATAAPSQASPADSAEDEFDLPRRRRKRLSGDGVETEADFFGEIREWARKNPEAALAWAQRQPDGDDARREALTDACFQLVQTDPERAMTLAEHFNLNRDAVLANLAQQWAAKDLIAASRWVADQPEGDGRNAMVKGVALHWSQTDPAAAAQFVVEQMSPGSALDAAVMMVVHQWAATDATGAAGWVEQYPAGPLRERLVSELTHITQARRDTGR